MAWLDLEDELLHEFTELVSRSSDMNAALEEWRARCMDIARRATVKYRSTPQGRAVLKKAIATYRSSEQGRETQREANRKYMRDYNAAKKLGITVAEYRSQVTALKEAA